MVENGVVHDQSADKRPLPVKMNDHQGTISCLAYRPSDTPQFVYINNALSHTEPGLNPYGTAPNAGDIPPKYEDINM